jgi:hypothetical protein
VRSIRRPELEKLADLPNIDNASTVRDSNNRRSHVTATLGEYTRDTAFWIVRQLAHAGINAETCRVMERYQVRVSENDKKRAEKIV